MRDISTFQRNVSKAARQIQDGEAAAKRTSGKSDPDACRCEYVQQVFQKFEKSQQEPVRIACACYCFFSLSDSMDSQKSLSESQISTLERYIRMRIRNVTEALIEEDAPEKIALFVSREWFGLTELNGFISIARERKKLQSLIYLMTVKNDRYGYQDRVWIL